MLYRAATFSFIRHNMIPFFLSTVAKQLNDIEFYATYEAIQRVDKSLRDTRLTTQDGYIHFIFYDDVEQVFAES